MLEKKVGLNPRLEYSTVPIADLAALRFELTFTRTMDKPTRKPRMTIFRLERTRDPKKRAPPDPRSKPLHDDDWPNAEIKQIEEFPVEFREPFDAVILDKDYVFITHTGRMYRAVPPADGKVRRAEEVKTLPGRIAAVITDTNHPGQHWLVCHEGEGLRFVPLHKDGKEVRIAKCRKWSQPLPYEPVLEYAQILVREKAIRIPKPKEK